MNTNRPDFRYGTAQNHFQALEIMGRRDEPGDDGLEKSGSANHRFQAL